MISTIADAEPNPFLALNQSVLAELVTFVDFAEGLTIAFVEVNFAADGDALVEALRQHPDCQDIRFEVLNFSQQPDLRFLRDEMVQRLNRSEPGDDRKRVVILRGLEAAIGTDGVGAYPPVLRDLNFVRDAYRDSVPYPLLFVLPSIAITRIAKFAPDFWAWRSGVFVFQIVGANADSFAGASLECALRNHCFGAKPGADRSLKQLLGEYCPAGQPIAPENLATCTDLYYKLGDAYLTQHQATKARDYLLEALKLAWRRGDGDLQQSIYYKLGSAFRQARQFENAIAAFHQAMDLAKTVDQQSQIAAALFGLGNVALEQRQFQQAKDYYQQCLKIRETQGNRYSQASIYHQLGSVAQELRQYEEAKAYYQQALEI